MDVISVREHTGGEGGKPSLGVLHDHAESVKDQLLPCPVQHLCLSGALERGEPWGVWGGQLFQKGAVIARKRLAGRPPKHETAA